jgi:transcriptional regulator with XRE-family HTH domain
MRTVKPTNHPVDPVLSDPRHLGAAIRSARTQHGVRLEDAAMQLGIGKQTLQNLEKGHPGVGIGTALRVAHAVGITLMAVPSAKRDQARALLVGALSTQQDASPQQDGPPLESEIGPGTPQRREHQR